MEQRYSSEAQCPPGKQEVMSLTPDTIIIISLKIKKKLSCLSFLIKIMLIFL